MANKKTARTPYRWANGSWHTRPENKPASSSSAAYNTPRVTHAPGGPSNPVTIGPNTSQANRDRLAGMVNSYITPTQPLSWEQQQAEITANRNVGISDAYASWNQGNVDQSYGFGTGAANPYSQAKLLEDSYKRQQIATTGSLASQGQLYSSTHASQKDYNSRNYSIGYDRLQRGYNQASGQIGFDRLSTYANAGSGVDSAKWEALLKSLGAL